MFTVISESIERTPAAVLPVRKTMKRQFLGGVAAALVALSAPLFLCTAASAQSAPEVTARSWIEGDMHYGAVTVAGKDIVVFKSEGDDEEAEEQAEELACDIEDLVSDKKFDATQLAPGRDGNKSVIKLGSQEVLAFDALDRTQGDDAPTDAPGLVTASMKLVNALRLACGAPVYSEASSAAEIATNSAPSVELKGASFSGQASWYGPRFHGRKTSDGHRFDMEKLTAAHRSLPFGTKLRVTNRRTGDSVVVQVNDRGPFIDGRVIDLSRGAARQINMLGSGVAMVDIIVLATQK